ncbi:MAG: oxidoreductase [Sphingomonadales bacterium 32-64-22]|nr:MAG: oxidoreductase [Sphingomonadales bacterium 32-64-22]
MTHNTEKPINRRQLLAAGAAASGALAASRAFAQDAQGQPLMGDPQLPEAAAQRTGWAVVGLGTFAVGQVMPGFLAASRARMTAFVSGNPDKAAMLGQRYGVERLYSYDNYDQIADADDIECVYIVLPVGLHAEYTIRALEAGKHVLCEKPMASTSTECERMIAAARANDRRLGVAYRIHFEPTNQVAAQHIANGDLGTLRHIRCEHGFPANPQWPPHAWRLQRALAGGGSMFDIGIYGLNTALMAAAGDAVVEVSGLYSYDRSDPRFAEVEGGVDWRLRLASGAIVSGSSSYSYSPYISRQTYIGDKGNITMSPACTYYDNEGVIDTGNGPQPLGAGPAATQFASQLDGFTDAVREGLAHLTPGEMGLRDIALIEAIYASADNGGIPVTV